MVDNPHSSFSHFTHTDVPHHTSTPMRDYKDLYIFDTPIYDTVNFTVYRIVDYETSLQPPGQTRLRLLRTNPTLPSTPLYLELSLDEFLLRFEELPV